MSFANEKGRTVHRSGLKTKKNKNEYKKNILKSKIKDFTFNSTRVNADIFWVNEKIKFLKKVFNFLILKDFIFYKDICKMYIFGRYKKIVENQDIYKNKDDFSFLIYKSRVSYVRTPCPNLGHLLVKDKVLVGTGKIFYNNSEWTVSFEKKMKKNLIIECYNPQMCTL